MFEADIGERGQIVFSGRLDASQCDKAQRFLDALSEPHVIDCSGLEYISSAGLGVLLRTQKRLGGASRLKLINVSHHIYDIFRYAGFDKIFDVEKRGS